MPVYDELKAVLSDPGNLRREVVCRLNQFIRDPDHVVPGLSTIISARRDPIYDEEDWLWAGLVRCFATMQGTASLRGVMAAREQWRWCNLPNDPDRVLETIKGVFNTNNPNNFRVRYVKSAYDMIMSCGGLQQATKHASSLESFQDKYDFIAGFHDIGPKYARNFWMDRHDPCFNNCFALDSRIQRVLDTFFVPEVQPWLERRIRYILSREVTYREVEDFLRNITMKSGRSPWECDRLLFHAMAPESRQNFLNWLDTGELSQGSNAKGKQPRCH